MRRRAEGRINSSKTFSLQPSAYSHESAAILLAEGGGRRAEGRINSSKAYSLQPLAYSHQPTAYSHFLGGRQKAEGGRMNKFI
jgi:hypothetical protein